MARFASGPDRRPAPPPEAPRPHAEAWRAIEAEGVRWEGQALLVGVAQDLPVRLILTDERLVLVANGEIALDIPRHWIRPEPKLAAVNGVHLYVTPEGTRPGSDATQSMLLRARAGRGAAAQLVAVLTGRPLPVEQGSDRPHIVAEIPAWKTTVGAATPVALPPLPDFDDDEPAMQAAWPPVEHEGVAPRPRTAAQRPARTERQPTSIAAWTDRNLAPEPEPVPMSVSRSARRQGTLADGATIAEDVVPAPPAQDSASGGRRGVVWALRAAILIILVGTAAWFGRDRLVIDVDALRDRLPSDVQRTLGIAEDAPDVAQSTEGTRDGDGTEGATNSGQSAASAVQQTEEALGIGGTTSPLPPSEGEEGAEGTGGNDVQVTVPEDPTAAQDEGNVVVPTEEPVPTDPPAVPTEAPMPTEEPHPTDPPVVPTEAPVVEPTPAPTVAPEPTQAPMPEPTVPPTPEPTVAPTPEPTVLPTLEPTAAPTIEPTPEPTVAPTIAPTVEGAEPAAVEPTVAATETPVPTPTIEPQAPSVAPETTPEQAVVANGFRYTIEGAAVGETLSELPQINAVGGYGEWVVLSVYGQNLTGTEQVFDMGAFRLYADGQEVQVDVGNAWVNGLVGNTPAYGNTDAILWAAGEGHRFVLTFLAPPDAQSLVLQAGDQWIDLAPALENPTPLLGDTATPAPSDLIQGTVLEVIDGETILLDVNGTQVTVRYLGIDAPDDCFAGEATAANDALVGGKTVTLERQATNIDARGNWVRDVWVENDAGQPVLVSEQLVEQGAATADISVPNTRFAGWLNAAQAQAQANGAGLWGTCGEGAAASTSAPVATAPRDASRTLQ